MLESGRVTDIRSRRGSKRREVFIDGDLRFVSSAAVVTEIGITVGDAVDPEDIASRIASLEPGAARERALYLLMYRDRSAGELTGRLRDDGYDLEVTEQVVTSLVESGLVDDQRYAAGLARSLVSNRGYGRGRVRRELLAHGVEDMLADEVLDEFAPFEEERSRARAAAREAKRSSDTVERLAARLCRRGYAPSESLAAARDAFLNDD